MQKLPEAMSEIQELLQRKRDNIEMVRQKIWILRGTDKFLMSMYYIDGCSYRRIAGLMGVHEGTISRRIRKITSRLLAGQYIRCLRNKQFLSPEQLEMAREYYLRRRGLRQIAKRKGSSFYVIRREIERIETIIESMEKDKRPQTIEMER